MNVVFVQEGSNLFCNLTFEVIVDNKPRLFVSQLLSLRFVERNDNVVDVLQCSIFCGPMVRRTCYTPVRWIFVFRMATLCFSFVNQLWWEKLPPQGTSKHCSDLTFILQFQYALNLSSRGSNWLMEAL